ncbi:MAG: 1-hydroxycarotenoid 3,4-desaturase CrtD [Saprospiraceae bacterium]
MKIGIIGAGVAGLAAAIRMASRGYEVSVFEANAYPGGKLSQFELAGYRFDAGPSLFTMPQYVLDLFKVAGIDPKGRFEYKRLATVCQYFWEDGTRLSAFADEKAFAQEVEEKLGVAATRIEKVLADSERKYRYTGKTFLEKSLHKVSTWTNWPILKSMLLIPTFDLFTNMDAVNRRLLKHPKLVQLFNRFATYNGSNPYKAPGLLTIIPYFEHRIGAFLPKGGMHTITLALFELAKELGVHFHFNTPVEEILVTDGRATALKIAGEVRPFDRIISNVDAFFTYQKLLPNAQHPHRILKQEKSTSAIIFYWGINTQFPELGLHNILFSEDYRSEFDHLSRGEVYEDPTIYINITQKYCPDDAPAGCENWFVMVNAPYDAGQNWEEIIQSVRQQTLQKISRILGRPIEALIACEETLQPLTIQSKTASHLGALYGTSSNNKMAAFLRHPNFSRRIKDLYFCGGSVHPGGGIPLCLLSAKIVDEVMHDRD